MYSQEQGCCVRLSACAFQEYEERLAQLTASYEAEQASRARLEEDISSLKNHYNLKLSALEESLRKEAGVDKAGGGCAVQTEGSPMLLICRGVGFRHEQTQAVFAKSHVWQPLRILKWQRLPGSNPCSRPSLINSQSGNSSSLSRLCPPPYFPDFFSLSGPAWPYPVSLEVMKCNFFEFL